MTAKKIDVLAKKIWDYHQLHQLMQKADVMFILGTNDIRVAEYAAQLYHEGWAPLLVFTGGIAHKYDLLRTPWDISEAQVFAARAHELGVPDTAMLLENEAQNTGDNFRLSRILLEERNIHPKKILCVQKPNMERRAYAGGKIIWPEVVFIMASPPISYEAYPNEIISKNDLINVMVGDLQRIREYPRLGYQVAQEIPADVWEAYERLVGVGFTKHLLTSLPGKTD